MPLLHSGPFQRLFPNARPFRVSCTTLSWSHLLRSYPLRRATSVLWVILLPAAANSFRGPQFPLRRATSVLWVILLPAAANSFRGPQFPLRRATAARRDTFLQAAANFLRDPQSPRVSSFGSPPKLSICFGIPESADIVERRSTCLGDSFH
jgi:hypothetical protein